MGTHPIFESDFDCLTECRLFVVFLVVFCTALARAQAVLPLSSLPVPLPSSLFLAPGPIDVGSRLSTPVALTRPRCHRFWHSKPPWPPTTMKRMKTTTNKLLKSPLFISRINV